jgi:hypothetical protein
MRSIAMPSLSHHTDSFERLNKALGTGKGHSIVGADGEWQAAIAEQPLKGCNGRLLAESSRVKSP